MKNKDKIKEQCYNEVIELRKKIFELKNRKFLAGKIYDITKIKDSPEKFQGNEKHIKSLFNAVQSGIVIIDAETHKIIDANPAAIKMIASLKKISLAIFAIIISVPLRLENAQSLILNGK